MASPLSLTSTRRLLTSSLTALALVIATGTTALAAGPVHTRDELHWDDEVALECSGFDVLGTSQDLYRNIVTWYDSAGNVEVQRRRVHFDFTLVNVESGATAEFIGQMVVVQDLHAGTTTILGASRTLWVGGRLVASVAGKTAFSPDAEMNVGRSSFAEFEEAICEALR